LPTGAAAALAAGRHAGETKSAFAPAPVQTLNAMHAARVAHLDPLPRDLPFGIILDAQHQFGMAVAARHPPIP
jgi:hypothetical protein